MGKIVKGVWDCAYCDSKQIDGAIRECPVCGRERDTNTRFYIDNPTNYISDEEAKKLNKNPDWLCSYCDALNSDDVDICYNCGATRADSTANYFENLAKQAELDAATVPREKHWDSEAEIDDEVSKLTKKPPSYGSVEEEVNGLVCEDYKENYIATKKMLKRKRRKKIVKTAIILGIVAALIVGAVFLFTPKIQDVTVQSFEWERSFEVEEYKTVQESGWSVPSGGRVYDQKQEIKEYIEVLDHYETKIRTYTEEVLDHYETVVVGHKDLGNGYFEEITERRPVYRTETKTETYKEPVYRSEPVYATKYYYDIEKWVYKKTCKQSGSDHEAKWADYTFGENERKGTLKEKYTVVVKNSKNKTKKYDFSYDEWMSLTVGQKLKIKTTVGGEASIVK